MKGNFRSFAAGMLVTGVAVGLAGTAMAYQQQATLDYTGIKITMDGKHVTPLDGNGRLVSPFAINGTTYLPVRAIANSMGLDVQWDGDTNTVILNSGSTAEDEGQLMVSIQLMGYYKRLSEYSDFLLTNFDAILNGAFERSMYEYVQEGTYAGMTTYQATIQMLSNELTILEGQYNDCLSYLTPSDITLMSEYRRLNSLLLSHMETIASGVPSAINNIYGAALQGWSDAMANSYAADAAFWRTYHSTF